MNNYWQGTKITIAKVLGRAKLLGPAYRIYERRVARRSASGHVDQGHEILEAGGCPVPSPLLITQVAGASSVDWFLKSGRLAAGSIEEVLARHGYQMSDFGSVLDF